MLQEGRRTEIQVLVHSRTTAQGSKPCLTTHSRANLALTLTNLVLRTKDLYSMLLDGLEVFLGVCVMSWDSSKLKMARVRHIYTPPSLVAVAPTVNRNQHRHRNFRCRVIGSSGHSQQLK